MDTDFSAYESAVLDDNLEHSGGITVTWKSASGATMPIGQSVVYNNTKYSLLDPYTPERNDALTWRYSPKFLHPVCRLDRVPFYIEVEEANGAKFQMSTINFTGKASTIADKLAAHFTVYGQTDGEFASTFGSWTAEMADNINTVITVSLDGCSIKAAASRIADAVGCNVFFDWNSHVIRFIAGSTIDGASYNCFHVLGGTTNMAKKSVSGIMVPVTRRLQLPDEYAGSIMNYCPSGGVRLTTDIILDDIYPKMELLIHSARARYCYVTDEAGERVEDEYGHYKMYAKWYITLEYTDGKPFSMSDVTEIADKPLSLLFQPDLEHFENSSVLAGHQFELVYYPSNAEEWGIDDVEPETNKFKVAAGEFRIIFKAEGSTILPSTDDEGLCPKEGDKVTLVNVSLSEHYTEIAQEKLEAAANSIIQMMMADSGSYRETVMGGYSLDVNQSHTVDGHSGIITDLNLNLHTGVADVTVGTWKSRKTLSGGVRDKIDSINVTTTGGNQGERGMSKAQFDALNMANPKTVVVGMKNEIDLLGTDIDAIREQEDKKFDIWFGSGVPTNSNYPASSWVTDEEKAQHVQDIYYDTDRSPASQGGRAYRYLKNESNNTYGWQHITDLDTEASLEKIADVASDGVICAGAEKQRLYIDWHNCMKEYTEYSDLTEDYGIDTERTAYMNAYKALWELLNGGSAPDASQSQTYISTPAWIASDALGEDTYLAEDYSGSIPEGWSIQQFYRQKWDIYYETLAALLAASDAKGQQLTEVARETAESKMQTYVSYDLPSIPYKKGDMWWKLDTQTVGNNNGTLYLCIKDSGETALMSDWTPAGKNYLDGAADFLATLAELLEKNISRKYNSSKHSVVVTWGATAPESPAVGDVWYDSVNKAIKEYVGSSWSNVDQYEVDIPNTKNVFEALMAYDTQSDRSVTFFEDPQYASGAQTYDVCFQRAEYHDNFTNSDIEGGLGIWLYDKENAWKHMKDNVSGLMENYGDHIINAIFGNEVLPSGMTSYASGLTTYKNFAEMFAKSADPDTGDLKAAAGVTVHIVTDPVTGDQQGYVDITGTFRSSDGDVVIEQVENPGYSGGSIIRNEITALRFYPLSSMSQHHAGEGIFIGVVELEGRIPHQQGTIIHYVPQIILNGGSDLGEDKTVVDKNGVQTTGRFSILNWDYEDNQLVLKTINGAGTPSSPVTFTTADGKTVTVIGGIITDVS